MRLLLALLLGIVPGLAFSQSRHLLKEHPYDTLEKYSYLIVTMRHGGQNEKDYIPTGTATGFFIRQKDSIYLVSARHNFSLFDPYQDTAGQMSRGTYQADTVTVVAIKVWYYDSGQKKSKQIPVSAKKIYAPHINLAENPDVDTFNVTNSFKDAQINSVEDFFPGHGDSAFTEVSPGDTVIAYGFSKERKNARYLDNNPRLKPFAYIAHGTELPYKPFKNDDAYAKMKRAYYAITPGLPHGVSGAPIFRVRKGGMPVVEFVGIQSGTGDGEKGLTSFIVRWDMLTQLYQIK